MISNEKYIVLYYNLNFIYTRYDYLGVGKLIFERINLET